jgi:hypothetical protein
MLGSISGSAGVFFAALHPDVERARRPEPRAAPRRHLVVGHIPQSDQRQRPRERPHSTSVATKRAIVYPDGMNAIGRCNERWAVALVAAAAIAAGCSGGSGGGDGGEHNRRACATADGVSEGYCVLDSCYDSFGTCTYPPP